MASIKKRKFDAPNAEQDAIEDDAPADETPKKRSRKRRCVNVEHWLKPPSEDLMQKLPGEIRNKIYDLVLLEGKTIFIGSARRMKWWKGQGFERFGRKLPFWKQPALFEVSKKIRQESMSFYYQSNSFTFVVGGSEIEMAIKFVKSIVMACNKIPEHGFDIVIPELRRKDIEQWFSIVKLIFGTELDDYEFDQTGEGRYWMEIFNHGFQTGAVVALFEEMIMLAVKAKHRGLTLAMLQEDFIDWAWTRYRCRF